MQTKVVTNDFLDLRRSCARAAGELDHGSRGRMARAERRREVSRSITPAQYRAMESEASVESRVTAWLEERGYEVLKLVTEVERGYRGKSRRNKPGTPDLFAVGPWQLYRVRTGKDGKCVYLPKLMFLELKRAKGGRHSKAQIDRAEELGAKGYLVFQHASNGVDVIEQLEEWLRQ